MSPLVPSLLCFTGLLVCALSLRALRMVWASWRDRVAIAHTKPMGHVVWRGFDTFSVALWCVLYAVGGVVLAAGVFVLGRW